MSSIQVCSDEHHNCWAKYISTHFLEELILGFGSVGEQGEKELFVNVTPCLAKSYSFFFKGNLKGLSLLLTKCLLPWDFLLLKSIYWNIVIQIRKAHMDACHQWWGEIIIGREIKANINTKITSLNKRKWGIYSITHSAMLSKICGWTNSRRFTIKKSSISQ